MSNERAISMNSIHIIGSRIGGGAENFYARLVNSLAEQSRVTAVTPPGCPTSRLLNPGVDQIHLKLNNNYDFLAMRAIRKLAEGRAPAVVQSYMGRATRLTRIRPGRGLVHVARLGGYYNLKAYRHAHHLVGNTKGICEYLMEEGVPADRVHYIGNFVDPIPAPEPHELDRLRQELDLPEGGPVITCAARFHENKGLPELLNAFSKVWKHVADVRLILVGDGPMAGEIDDLIESLKLQDSVIRPGWCDPKPYYHLADILTSPSRHEPLGNTILEAWACGKPLVATQTQGAVELITHGQDGLITPLNNADALADAFLRLIGDEAARASLAAAGKRTLQDRFSREIITGNYLSLYEDLLASV